MKPSIDKDGKIVPREGREPMVDIISSDDEIKVVAEILSVNKEDIRITATGNTVTVQTNVQARRYNREIDLLDTVDPNGTTLTSKMVCWK